MKLYSVQSIFATAALGVILASCSSEQPESTSPEAPVGVTVALPGQQTTGTLTASGQLQSTETAVISTRVMGFITSVNVKPGDVVNKGQLLITISNSDILAKKAQAQAMVTEAEAALTDAQKDFDRYTELYRQQSASAKELENITLRYQSLKAKTEAAKQMQREAEAMLTYTNLTAPFAGVITQKQADEGSMASPGVPLLFLEKQGNYEVITSVAEADMEHLKTGIPATVFLKAIGKKISGTVSEISPSSSNSGGRYGVKISIPQHENNGLYAGMSVTVTFAIPGTAASGVFVPVSALVFKDQLVGIYTVSESNTALLRWLRPGKVYDNQAEILSGLNAGEHFILQAESKLYNGAPVQIKSN
jgi:RND family efflux transporter MFP subunit